MTLEIHVRTIPQRRDLRRVLLSALAQSDLRDLPVTWHEQPTETYDAEWWERMVTDLGGAGAADDLLLFFEDDVHRINRHALHNIETWPALAEPDFGLGWLCVPNGLPERPGVLVTRASGAVFSDARHINNSAGVLVRRGWLAAMAALAHAEAERLAVGYGHRPFFGHILACTDSGWSQLTWELGRKVYVHLPGLVTYDGALPSVVVGQVTPEWERQSDEHFDAHWRAPTPAFEAFLAEMRVQIAQADAAADPLIAALREMPERAVVLEFGVWRGDSLRRCAEARPAGRIVGFDTFRGLPERWRPGFSAGAFDTAGAPPSVPNAELVVGPFAETLSGWLSENPGPIDLVHVDCDLYASTADVLTALGERIGPETVIVFDELIGYAGFEHHETLALFEHCARHELRPTVLRVGGAYGQTVSLRVHRCDQ